MHFQREGNQIALLQRLWIKTEKPPVEVKVGRVAGGVYLKTVISYSMLTEPIKTQIKSQITKGTKLRKHLLEKKHWLQAYAWGHISVNPRPKLAQLLRGSMKITFKSQSSHQARLWSKPAEPCADRRREQMSRNVTILLHIQSSGISVIWYLFRISLQFCQCCTSLQNNFKNLILSCFYEYNVYCSVLFLLCIYRIFYAESTLCSSITTMTVWESFCVYSSSNAIQTKVVFLFPSVCVFIPLSVFIKHVSWLRESPWRTLKTAYISVSKKGKKYAKH